MANIRKLSGVPAMKPRFFAWAMAPTLLVVGLAFCGDDELKDAKQAAKEWWGRIAAIEKDRDAKLAAAFKEMREQDAKLQEILEAARAATLHGTNQFVEAEKQMAKAQKAFASDAKMLGALLIQHGSLYAILGDYDKAHATVLRGWRTLQDYSAKNPRDVWPLIDGAVAAGGVLLQIDRPDDAADCINAGMARCERPASGISLRGTPLLARCLLAKAELANVQGDHATAQLCSERALELVKRLYPRPSPPHLYPVTWESAAGLNSLAAALLHLRQEPRAFELSRQAQLILEKLFPKGHLGLTTVNLNLANLYWQRGQKADALNAVGKALTEYKRLFPAEKYKKSHPALIRALVSLGHTMNLIGRHEDALQLHAEAWNDCLKHYGTSSHPDKVDTLLSYGRSLRSAGRIVAAAKKFQEALDMAHELYPKIRYPGGHPQLAFCLLHIGSMQGHQRQYAASRKSFEQAGDIYRQFYPQGHPFLSVIAQYQGTAALLQSGDREAARAAFAHALTLDRRELRRFAWIASEAEAIAFAQPRRSSYHGYLAMSRDAANAQDAYAHVWMAKSVITRVLQERRAARRASQAPSEVVSQRALQLRDLSAQISLLLNENADSFSRGQKLSELMRKEERLRRELEKAIPEFHRSAEMDRLGPAELAKRLPERSVFVDLVRYDDFLDSKGVRPRYAAFVLAPGGSLERIDLDLAAPIDQAVREWRKAVARWNPQKEKETLRKWRAVSDQQAARLRELVWAKIAQRFPQGTRRVYLCPDGDLTRFPFAALPGRTTGSILLEECTIAYVPHGPFLLDRLLHPSPAVAEEGRFLALGDVEYEGVSPLRGSVEAINLAERSSRPSIVLKKKAATVGNLCAALPQARFAHLATHAFFKEEELQAEHLQERDYLRDWRFDGSRDALGVGLGKRSPLSYTGLVLAGPTQPTTANSEGAILTGSTIAELSLEQLQLVVISGCETGLGEYTAGEGVQGLQRAFHLAGCPNVIASLWLVDDAATKVLMEEFYRQLWEKKQSPLEALHLAQLEIYRHPERVPGVESGSHEPCPVNLWAGFVHSGTGL